MNSEKYIGLDVHQATISVAVLDSTGQVSHGIHQCGILLCQRRTATFEETDLHSRSEQAPVFVMVTQHDLARGIYVRLAPRHHSGPDDICLAGRIVVTINQHGSVSRLLLSGAEVSREEFERALKSKLAERANWEVFVEADDSVSFADPMYAIDVANALHAKSVILTPKLKRQMAENSCPLR